MHKYIREKIMSFPDESVIFVVGTGLGTFPTYDDVRRIPLSNLTFKMPVEEKWAKSDPYSLFNIDFFFQNQLPLLEILRGLILKEAAVDPHPVLVELAKDLMGKIIRVYTDNFDLSERAAGIPEDKIVYCSGRVEAFRCCSCREYCPREYFCKETKECIKDIQDVASPPSMNIPCPSCKKNTIKPDVRLIGEPMDPCFDDRAKADFNKASHIVFYGSDLRTRPINTFANNRTRVPATFANHGISRYINKACGANPLDVFIHI